MIRRLRWKVVGITMAFVSAILLCVFAGIYFTAQENLRSSTEQQLHEALLSGGSSWFLPGQGDSASLPCFIAEIYGGTARISGSSYYQLDEATLTEIVNACLAQEEDSGLLRQYRLRYVRQFGVLSVRIAFTDSTLEQQTLRALVRNCLGIGFAALAVLLLCCYLLSGLITRPVEKAWEAQQRFLSDASHELKTPLTVILASGDLLEEHTGPNSAAQPYVDNIRSESRRMRSLVEQMLTLSRAENPQRLAQFAPVDLSDLAMDAALRFEPVAYETGHALHYDIQECVTLRGDHQQLQQLLGVLLDNAIKYAGEGCPIHLTLQQTDKQILLQTENGGTPIPQEKLEHLFERFYRADGSRSDHGSFGLGLSIAQAIVKEHNGTIRCQSDAQSTRFTVTLPLSR